LKKTTIRRLRAQAVPSAEQAMFEANRIAFGPLMFEAARALWKRGVLDALRNRDRAESSMELIAADVALSHYATRLLLEAGESMALVCRDGDDFRLTKTGMVLLADTTVQVNFDFVHDFCYRAFHHFDEAISSGRPAGLREFGAGETLYPLLTHLAEPARSSWYRFDHHYSDSALPQAIELLLERRPRRVLDIGGNTGRFARALQERAPAVEVCIVDLPSQVNATRDSVREGGNDGRIGFHAMDVLEADAAFPRGFDVIWVSQFLDCFAPPQIIDLLVRMREALSPGGALLVMEPCPDNQRFAASSYSLIATSLYFACIANGNSRMYCTSDWRGFFTAAGLTLVAEHGPLGICQTLFHCEPLA
jgi:SAM-dependent methyltransferase